MEEPRRTGIYHFTDPLKYFKVRVTITRITSSILLEQRRSKFDGQSEEDLQMKNLLKKDDFECHNFTWQEKVFSQDEIEWYSQKRNYRTFLENKYHQDITEKFKSEVDVFKRLFSYTEADLSGDEWSEEPSRSEHKSTVAFSESKTSGLRLRHVLNENVENPVERWKSKSPFVKPTVINKNKKLQRLDLHSQCMCIMADLRSHHNSSDPDSKEVLLCKIETDSNNILKISPDFSQESSYCIQNKNGEKFEYTLENVSRQPTTKDSEEEKELTRELYTKYLDIVRNNVGSDFQIPPIEVLKMFTFGEIVSASGFNGSNLCVFYYIDLPKNWSASDSSWLTGVTQTCKTTVENYEDAAFFSFPFEGELTLALGNLDDGDVSITSPTLLMEVLSYDCWGCVRTEGYGYVSLPLLPGFYTIKVSTWRPIGNSLKSRLQHYFTGGLTDLEDLSCIAVPNTFEGKQLSKLGFTTESSGTVTIRLHAVQQSRYYMKSENKTNYLLDKLTTVKSKDNISLVLSAFQRARQRMLAARQKFLTSR